MQHNPSFTSKIFNLSSLPSIFSDDQHGDTENSRNISFLTRFFRNRFIGLFTQIEHGRIRIYDPIGTLEFGDPNSDLDLQITIKDTKTYTRLALGGSNGAAEAFIEGLWSCNNPTNLIRIMLRNRKQLDSMETGVARLAQFIYQVVHNLNRNSKSGSRKNIAAHYDLGNDFFRLFLDEKMMYSSALYEENDDLNNASVRKLQRICDKLKIDEKDNVVEIGSGWGGFACYAAATTGCHITTITISKEQYDATKARVKNENLADLVTVKLIDYRDLEGQFDKLVSIEMIEAVGHQYLDTYFNKINQLLKPSGQALIQAIVIDDDRYHQALKEVDYIKRFIFPGSFMPCYGVIKETANKNQLGLRDLYDMGGSYAKTLLDWRQRFYEHIDTIDHLGYDDQFKRMWEFYLCYCEGGFSEKAISVGQLLFSKNNPT